MERDTRYSKKGFAAQRTEKRAEAIAIGARGHEVMDEGHSKA